MMNPPPSSYRRTMSDAPLRWSMKSASLDAAGAAEGAALAPGLAGAGEAPPVALQAAMRMARADVIRRGAERRGWCDMGGGRDYARRGSGRDAIGVTESASR